jgi:hypothetical protein
MEISSALAAPLATARDPSGGVLPEGRQPAGLQPASLSNLHSRRSWQRGLPNPWRSLSDAGVEKRRRSECCRLQPFFLQRRLVGLKPLVARLSVTTEACRNVLVHQVESNLYERQGRALSNFSRTLPAPQCYVGESRPAYRSEPPAAKKGKIRRLHRLRRLRRFRLGVWQHLVR